MLLILFIFPTTLSGWADLYFQEMNYIMVSFTWYIDNIFNLRGNARAGILREKNRRCHIWFRSWHILRRILGVKLYVAFWYRIWSSDRNIIADYFLSIQGLLLCDRNSFCLRFKLVGETMTETRLSGTSAYWYMPKPSRAARRRFIVRFEQAFPVNRFIFNFPKKIWSIILIWVPSRNSAIWTRWIWSNHIWLRWFFHAFSEKKVD